MKQTWESHFGMRRAYRNALIYLGLGFGFALFGFLAAYAFGHLQTRWLFFAIPNLLSAVMVGGLIQEIFGKRLLSVIATSTFGVIVFYALLLLGQYVSGNRVEKLLTAQTSIVTAVIVDSKRCYKGCKWVATFRYRYDGSDFIDEVTSRDRELRIGQRMSFLISRTNPDVKRFLEYE